jgi:hypothetical protein
LVRKLAVTSIVYGVIIQIIHELSLETRIAVKRGLHWASDRRILLHNRQALLRLVSLLKFCHLIKLDNLGMIEQIWRVLLFSTIQGCIKRGRVVLWCHKIWVIFE